MPMSIHQHHLTFRRSVALDSVSGSGKGVRGEGVLRLIAAHGATGCHWYIQPVSTRQVGEKRDIPTLLLCTEIFDLPPAT